MWTLGITVAFIIVATCILYALARAAGHCEHDEDHWSGY